MRGWKVHPCQFLRDGAGQEEGQAASPDLSSVCVLMLGVSRTLTSWPDARLGPESPGSKDRTSPPPTQGKGF